VLNLFPKLNKVYTSDWYENKVGVIDLQQMKVIKKSQLMRSQTAAHMRLRFISCTCQMNEARRKPSLMFVNDRLLTTLHFESETGMPNTIRCRARYTSTCRTKISL